MCKIDVNSSVANVAETLVELFCGISDTDSRIVTAPFFPELGTFHKPYLI